ncbi:MAG: arginine--tRNA ligase [Pseudomonadota bacterium]
MAHPASLLADTVRKAVVDAFGPEHAGADPAVHRSAFADYQADVALRLARAVKRPPLEIAELLAQKVEVSGLCSEVRASRPGFVNFTLDRAFLERSVEALARDERAGVPRAERPETVVIDYSAPNVAKEMHVGHLRTTVIGDALARLLGFLGHRVIRQNHIGDWGTPFGMLIEHMLDIGVGATDELGLFQFTEFYQAARKKFDDDPAFADRSRKRVVLLQQGDAETLALWERLVEASRVYFRAVYDKLGVLLEDSDIRGESAYNADLPGIADELERRGIARVDDGALCVFLPEFTGRDNEPLPLIVRKRDGGYGYAATDLAALRYRVETLGATRVLYVVGAPQHQHLAMVFAVAKRAGWLPDSVRAEHVAFGSILDENRKMFRTRAGESVRLLALLDEAIERAERAIREKNPELPAEERAEVARQVGIGAIKYADLSTERIKDYVFDWSRMLAFEGNTGPYLQYAHARICSILRKANETGIALASDLLRGQVPEGVRVELGEPAERALAIDLLDFAAAVDAVGVALQPHRLCSYLYELANTFTAFYEACPVLRADNPALRDSRLVLAAATRRVLATGLGVLGIAAPARM